MRRPCKPLQYNTLSSSLFAPAGLTRAFGQQSQPAVHRRRKKSWSSPYICHDGFHGRLKPKRQRRQQLDWWVFAPEGHSVHPFKCSHEVLSAIVKLAFTMRHHHHRRLPGKYLFPGHAEHFPSQKSGAPIMRGITFPFCNTRNVREPALPGPPVFEKPFVSEVL